MSEVLPVLLCVIVVGVLLAANYIAVTIQERKSGDKPAFTPDQIDWSVVSDSEIQAFLQANKKIEAIKVYRQRTGVGLREAKDAIDYATLHPDEAQEKKKAPEPELTDGGVRDLIAEGRLSEAVETYRTFTGMDEYSARDAIERIQNELDTDAKSAKSSGE
jgi:ribosomal protein L7/L12